MPSTEADASLLMYEPSDLARVALADALRLAILTGEDAGCWTYPVLSVDRDKSPPDRLSIPRMWQIPARGDGVMRRRLVPRGHRPPGVRIEVWAALVVRDVESAVWARDIALDNKYGLAQLRALGAAALHDICGQLMPTVANVLAYGSAGSAHKAAARGRGLWRALRGWPWACLPPGRLEAGWQQDAAVRLGWQLWRAETGQERPPVAGWGPVADAFHPEGRRRHSGGAGRARSRSTSDDAVQELLEHASRRGLTLTEQQARGLIERSGDAARPTLAEMAKRARARSA
jgi:hypothetical protein